MSITVLVGAQWGDEGKGKIIDVLTWDAAWVVRYQGGANAGHTVEIGADRYVLHLVPSGILRAGCRCVIGNGVVVDPLALVEELDMLARAGIEVRDRLFISDRAHLVLPQHRALDAGGEAARTEGERIGTTQRGIGPAYEEKAARTGLRMGALRRPDLEAFLRAQTARRNAALEARGLPASDAESTARLIEAGRRLAPFVVDTLPLLHEAVARGEAMLLEGAQGTMLDNDFGTYPFVTSSNATAGGAATGSGIPPHRIDRVIGVLKAYTTRVGEGPFPTERTDAVGERLRAAGREFGATTGRPRRCGWLDLVVARHAARINGVDAWALTKLDVLDGVDPLRICTAYRVGGATLDRVPSDVDELAGVEPVYEELPGWKGSVREATGYGALPPQARAYVERIESETGVPVGLLSVGPERDRTFARREA